MRFDPVPVRSDTKLALFLMGKIFFLMMEATRRHVHMANGPLENR